MSMINNETLCFQRLESCQDFLRNPNNVGQRGVYIWGFKFFDNKTAVASEFLPYYVGKHLVNIHRRIQEHVRDIREGGHRILLKERFLEKDCYKYFSYNKYSINDYAYIKTDGRTKKELNHHEYISMLPHINNYIDNLFVTYLSINNLCMPSDVEKIYINSLEKYVQERVVGLDRLISRSGNKYPESFHPSLMPGEGTEHLFRDKKLI